MRATRPEQAPRSRRRRHRRASAGFTFLGLLFLIALMATMAAAASTTWSFVGQREKERDLLFVGHEYRIALERYRQAHATRAQPLPTSLAQLLDDGDRLVARRYLRRLYVDPMTGSNDWGLVRNAQGGITGVFSLSGRTPIRSQSPDPRDAMQLAGAKTYRDWIFGVADGEAPAAVPAASSAAPSSPSASEPPPASTPGNVPGWNYDRDGEPPLKWKTPPPQATDNP